MCLLSCLTVESSCSSVVMRYTGSVIAAAGIDGIQIGDRVDGEVAYDPASSTNEGPFLECSVTSSQIYKFLSEGMASLSARIGSRVWEAPLLTVGVFNDSCADVGVCDTGSGDELTFESSQDSESEIGLSFFDCQSPYDLVASSSLPNTVQDIGVGALTSGSGAIRLAGSVIYFSVAATSVSASATTWGAIKSMYAGHRE